MVEDSPNTRPTRMRRRTVTRTSCGSSSTATASAEHRARVHRPPRRRRPPAVILAHADGRDEELSFADIARESSQFAHYLAAQGVVKGDRVAVMLEPSRAFYVAIFGAIKFGAIAVPLFTLFGPGRYPSARAGLRAEAPGHQCREGPDWPQGIRHRESRSWRTMQFLAGAGAVPAGSRSHPTTRATTTRSTNTRRARRASCRRP